MQLFKAVWIYVSYTFEQSCIVETLEQNTDWAPGDQGNQVDEELES